MNPLPAAPPLADAELDRRRAEIRRSLTRANTAGIVILLIVIALAAAVVVAAFQARQIKEQAVRARREAIQAATDLTQAEARVFEARLSLPGAIRAGRRPGRRQESLEVIQELARKGPLNRLRSDAVASLVLTDLRDTGVWFEFPPGTSAHALDGSLTHCAIGNNAGLLTVHRMSDGRPVTTIRVASNAIIRAIRLNRDARFAAVLTVLPGQLPTRGEVALWDLHERRLINQVSVDAPPEPGMMMNLMEFSADGKRLLVQTDPEELRIWNVAELTEWPALYVGWRITARSLHWTEPEVLLATPDSMERWRYEGRWRMIEDQRRPEGAERRRNPEMLRLLAWNPAGTLSAACGPAPVVMLRQHDASQANVPATLPRMLRGHSAPVNHVCWRPQGDMIASQSQDGSTRVWSLDTHEEILTTDQGSAIAFSEDGARLAYSRSQRGIGVWELQAGVGLREWRLVNGEPIGTLKDAPVTSVDFSADSRLLAAVGGGALHVWDPDVAGSDRQVPCFNSTGGYFTHDSRSIVTVVPMGLFLWHVRGGGTQGPVVISEPPTRLETRWRRMPGSGSVTRGTNDWLGLGQPGGAALVNLAHPTRRPLFLDHVGGGLGVAVSPDQRWIAACGNQRDRVKIWAFTNRDALLPDRLLPVSGAVPSFSPDGRWLLLGGSDSYRLLDTHGWREVWRRDRSAAGELGGHSAFSPDGHTIALCPTPRQVQLVDATDGHELVSFDAPRGDTVHSLSFSRDGKRLAVAGSALTVQAWDLPVLRRELASLGLDWGASTLRPTPSTPASAPDAPPVAEARFALGMPLWFPLIGAVVALIFAVFTFGHQRRLVAAYDAVDALASQRNQQLARAEVELVHSQKMEALGTLAAGVAHDFNNLLSVISLSNDLIRREAGDRAEVAEESTSIEDAVAQGKQIVESMLGYSRARADAPTNYSVGELVADTVALLSKQFLRGITLELDADAASTRVTGARARTQQILLNLIVNAAEAMKGAGKLTLHTMAAPARPALSYIVPPAVDGPGVELVVRDSGPGIAADIVPRIFEPFFTTKTLGARTGTGLGLSTVHTIARMEGCGLAVDTAPGAGTTFRVWIPARPPQGTETSA